MTWAFGYLAVLLVGLVLSGVTGLLRRLPFVYPHRHLVVPLAEQSVSAINLAARRAGVALIVFGVTGLLMSAFGRTTAVTTLIAATVTGLAALAFALCLLRRSRAAVRSTERATVVREISPGGFGQVLLTHAGSRTVVAARSVDVEPLAEGSEVEVVDCTRSVITVRRVGRGLAP